MRVAVIRHHEEDSAGFIGDAFEARGGRLETWLFPAGGPLPDPGQFDHIVVLGAIWSVTDTSPARAWIGTELAWLRAADTGGVPVLGICFGAQALAAALGGRVERAPRPEVGWYRVDTVDPELIPRGPWLQFHEDRFIPPPQARLLARNRTGVQAFAAGPHLAVQFHPEVDAAQLKQWLAGSSAELLKAAGRDPGVLVAQTTAQEDAAARRADQIVAGAILVAQSSGAIRPA